MTDGAPKSRTIIDVVEEWFGERLSQKVIERCTSLTPLQVLSFLEYLNEQSRWLDVPECAPGQTRPLATTSVSVKAQLLLADDVAVPNLAMPRPLNTDIFDFAEPDDFGKLEYVVDPHEHAPDIQIGLSQLLRLKPLIDAGKVRVLPYSLDVYRRRAVNRIRSDAALYALACAFFPEGERQGALEFRRNSLRRSGLAWTPADETGWIRVAMGFPIGPAQHLFTLADAVVALDIEVTGRIDAQVSPVWAEVLSILAVAAEDMPAYWEAWTPEARERVGAIIDAKIARHLGRVAETDAPSANIVAPILGFAMPRLDRLTFDDIARLHSDSDELANFRSALRRGLSGAYVSAEGPNWADQARLILQEELTSASADLRRSVERSSFLRQFTIGLRSVLISGVGAGAVAAAGGGVTEALATGGATASASAFLSSVEGLMTRRRSRPFLAHYVLFEDDPDSVSDRDGNVEEAYWHLPWFT